jgi:RES domain-containing protein
MPTVYRITRAPHAEISGEGARLYGGRWNHVGTPAVYASENRALAVLETLVHVNPRRVPTDLVIVTISIPETVPRTTWTEDHLPDRWHELNADEARDRGTQWLASNSAAVLWLPSAILPAESNIILNPGHPDHGRALIVETEPFAFDPRLVALRVPR